VVEVISAAAKWKLRRRNPFGVTVGQLAGLPPLVEQFVVGRAREGQSVDVGISAVDPLVDMMDLASVAGNVAAGMAASAFAPVQDKSLIGAGDPFGPPQIQRTADSSLLLKAIKPQLVALGAVLDPHRL